MRISDWSSDVCSSDLGIQRRPGGTDGGGRRPGHRLCAAGLRATRWCNWLTRLAHRMTNTATPSPQAAVHGSDIEGAQTSVHRVECRDNEGVSACCLEIGRASCRERVCQYV